MLLLYSKSDSCLKVLADLGSVSDTEEGRGTLLATKKLLTEKVATVLSVWAASCPRVGWHNSFRSKVHHFLPHSCDLPDVKVQFGAVAALMKSLQSSALTVPGRRNLFALIVHIFPLNVQIICDVQIVLTNEAVQWSESSRDPFILSQTTFAGGAGTRGRERLVLLLCSLVTNR